MDVVLSYRDPTPPIAGMKIHLNLTFKTPYLPITNYYKTWLSLLLSDQVSIDLHIKPVEKRVITADTSSFVSPLIITVQDSKKTLFSNQDSNQAVSYFGPKAQMAPILCYAHTTNVYSLEGGDLVVELTLPSSELDSFTYQIFEISARIKSMTALHVHTPAPSTPHLVQDALASIQEKDDAMMLNALFPSTHPESASCQPHALIKKRLRVFISQGPVLQYRTVSSQDATYFMFELTNTLNRLACQQKEAQSSNADLAYKVHPNFNQQAPHHLLQVLQMDLLFNTVNYKKSFLADNNNITANNAAGDSAPAHEHSPQALYLATESKNMFPALLCPEEKVSFVFKVVYRKKAFLQNYEPIKDLTYYPGIALKFKINESSPLLAVYQIEKTFTCSTCPITITVSLHPVAATNLHPGKNNAGVAVEARYHIENESEAEIDAVLLVKDPILKNYLGSQVRTGSSLPAISPVMAKSAVATQYHLRTGLLPRSGFASVSTIFRLLSPGVYKFDENHISLIDHQTGDPLTGYLFQPTEYFVRAHIQK